MKKNYIALWSLLAVAFALIIAYSCLEDTIKVGEWELKSSGIADRLTMTPDTVGANAADSFAGVADGDIVFPAPLDSASHNILIIGDSMLEGLNPALAEYARHNGHTLNSVIWYSSTSNYWGDCDTLKVFLKQFKPSYIFISLGGNELFVKDIIEKRDKYVKNFLAQIGDIPYIWIGPPNWKPDTGINELIKRNVKPGTFFESNGMHFEREKDGAHPTKASARLWMDSIARWMPGHASHPIRMEKPDTLYKARPNKVVVLQPLK